MKEIDNFLKKVKKVNNNRKHKVSNSYGVYDGYKYYRKNKPKELKYIISESQYFFIIREINKLLIEDILNGENIKFPCRMGQLELRKRNSKISFKDGKLITNLPIDWDKTLKLWFEDSEAYNKKILIRIEDKEVYKVYYNKSTAIYNNKSFYDFNVNRELKLKIKEKIKNGSLDTPYYNYGGTIH